MSTQDFERCRLCALPICSNSLIPFFDTIYEPMIDKLILFGIKIKKDDGLPECICQGCIGILTTFIETMELFLAADKKLKRLLKNTKHEIQKATERKEDQGEKGFKRKTEDNNIEIIDTKRTKRRDGPNLLRKAQTPQLNDSRKFDDEAPEKDSESTNKNEETEVKKKQERKEDLKMKVRNDSIDSTSKAQDSAVKIETENVKECIKKEPSNSEIINVIERHDHNYEIVNNKNRTEETSAKNDSINNLKVNSMEAEIEILKKNNFGTQINKTMLSKNIKILTLENLGLSGKFQANSPTTSNASASVYTQPLDDKEIDVFTCLECSQISWNRKATLEHIYKEHAQGAITYKARYMVKRIKNAEAHNSQKQIVCMLCFLTFHDSHPYLEHLTSHFMAIYKCIHCYQNFSSNKALKKHKEVHKDAIIICKICNKAVHLEFYNTHEKSHTLQAHLQKVNERNKSESKKRSKSYGEINDDTEKKRRKILNNRKTISGSEAAEGKKVEGITCEREAKNDGSGSVDEDSSENKKQPLKVSVENKAVQEIQEIPQEKLKTEIPKNQSTIYKCSNCLKTFKDQGTILKHMQKIHTPMWTNKKSFLTAKILQTDEADANEIYMCRICTTDFNNESNYLTHLQTHHNCKYCNKTFYHKEEMKVHLRSHEKPYRCDMCDASFYVEKNYLYHKLTHSHQCEFCKASYRTMESLVNHKKIVHPKVSCPICSVGFESPELLSKHEATHAKQKNPSLCELCGKSYSNVTRFNSHMLTHSEDSEFSCRFCPMSFKSAAKLRRHQRFSHLEDYTRSLRESLESG